MDSCPACGSTDLNDQGYHPVRGQSTHVLLCKGCGSYLTREVTIVVIAPGSLLGRFVFGEPVTGRCPSCNSYSRRIHRPATICPDRWHQDVDPDPRASWAEPAEVKS